MPVNPENKADLREFQELRPYLRTFAAFVSFIRYGGRSFDEYYADADAFLNRLYLDIENRK